MPGEGGAQTKKNLEKESDIELLITLKPYASRKLGTDVCLKCLGF